MVILAIITVLGFGNISDIKNQYLLQLLRRLRKNITGRNLVEKVNKKMSTGTWIWYRILIFKKDNQHTINHLKYNPYHHREIYPYLKKIYLNKNSTWLKS